MKIVTPPPKPKKKLILYVVTTMWEFRKKLDPESSDRIGNKMGLLAFISLMQSKKVVLNELKQTPDQQIQLKQ